MALVKQAPRDIYNLFWESDSDGTNVNSIQSAVLWYAQMDSSEVVSRSNIDWFIRLAENRFIKDIEEHPSQVASTTLTLNDGRAPVPQDLKDVEKIYFPGYYERVFNVTTFDHVLLYHNYANYDIYYYNAPFLYSLLDIDAVNNRRQFIFAPLFDNGTELTLHYKRQYPFLGQRLFVVDSDGIIINDATGMPIPRNDDGLYVDSSNNILTNAQLSAIGRQTVTTTNYILENEPNAYIYAAMGEIARRARDPEQVAYWDSLYDDWERKFEDQVSNFSGGYIGFGGDVFT